MLLQRLRWAFIAISCLFCIQFAQASHPIHHYGWLEAARLLPYDSKLIAKFDTGAKTSSVNANHIMYYQKGSETWVRFSVPLKHSETQLTFDKKVIGHSKIKIKDGITPAMKKHYVERPLVEMDMCVGHEHYSIVMNLADRHSFNYTLLIGRKAIVQMHATINPNKQFTRKLAC